MFCFVFAKQVIKANLNNAYFSNHSVVCMWSEHLFYALENWYAISMSGNISMSFCKWSFLPVSLLLRHLYCCCHHRILHFYISSPSQSSSGSFLVCQAAAMSTFLLPAIFSITPLLFSVDLTSNVIVFYFFAALSSLLAKSLFQLSFL